jgi:peptide/nickel transport system substrate-binding protein
MGRYTPVLRTLSLLMLLAWMFSACAGQTSMPVFSGKSPLLGSYSFTPAPGSQPSGTVVLGDTGFPTAVNPLFSATSFDLEVSSALWAAPVVFDNHFHAQPDQLTEVPLPENGGVQDGGKTIIMHLRRDLRWSDGQPILAADFAYWWELDQNADTGAIATAGYDQIASITTPDSYTVILHMRQPFGAYLSYLPFAAPEAAWGNIPPIDLQNRPDVFLAPLVTDGPYKLKSFVDEHSYTLVPDSFYTSTTFHGPFLAQVIYRAFPTSKALTTAVRGGLVDVAAGYMEDDLSALQHLPSAMHTQITPAAAYEHLDFNLTRPVLQLVGVRQAIQLAINRCGILMDVLHTPDCTRLIDQVEPPPSLVFDASIHPTGYDPREARQLLSAAGWLPGTDGWLYKQGKPFVVSLATTNDDPVRAAVARFIQKDLRAVGIQVQIKLYDPAVFFGVYTRGGILATGSYDLSLFAYANSSEPDNEYGVFASTQIPSATNPDLGNYGRVSDPIIDQALTQGRDSVAFATRIQAYQRFLARLAQEVYLVPLYTAVNILVVNTHLRNVTGNPNTLENYWNIADWWISP